MKRVTLSYYLVPNGKGKPKRTTYRLSPDEAAKRFPGAQPCPHGSIEVDQPETQDESMQAIYHRSVSYRKD